MFQQSIKNFSVVFETANGNLTVSAGDLITGHISFDLTKVTRISSLTMKVRGRAHVHWSSGSRKRRRHYSEKMEFFSMKSIIMQENNGMHTFWTCLDQTATFPSFFVVVVVVPLLTTRSCHQTRANLNRLPCWNDQVYSRIIQPGTRIGLHS